MINLSFNKQERAKKSYSQCGEDLIVNFIIECTFPSNHKGTYIDIGANHPFHLNNTYLLYKQGWHGINIDPISENIKLFQRKRSHDINICAGIGTLTSEREFYVMDPSTVSTFDKRYVEKCISHGHRLKRSDKVSILSVEDIVSRYNICNNIDLLNIDIEGDEFEIIKTFVNLNIVPKIMICETLCYSPILNQSNKERNIIDKICELGFTVYADTFINTIFVSNQFWKSPNGTAS